MSACAMSKSSNAAKRREKRDDDRPQTFYHGESGKESLTSVTRRINEALRLSVKLPSGSVRGLENRGKNFRGGHPVPGPRSSTVDPFSHRPPKAYAVWFLTASRSERVLRDDVCALDERASRAQKKPQRSEPLHAGRLNAALTGSLINHREAGGPKCKRDRSTLWPIVVPIHILSSDE